MSAWKIWTSELEPEQRDTRWCRGTTCHASDSRTLACDLKSHSRGGGICKLVWFSVSKRRRNYNGSAYGNIVYIQGASPLTSLQPSLLPLFGSLACCWWGPVIHWALQGGLARAAAGLSGQVIKKTTGRGIHRQGWLVSCSRQQSPAASPDPVSPI